MNLTHFRYMVIILSSLLILLGCSSLYVRKDTSPTPESPTPESPTPESPTPESPTPESPTPESPTPESPKYIPPFYDDISSLLRNTIKVGFIFYSPHQEDSYNQSAQGNEHVVTSVRDILMPEHSLHHTFFEVCDRESRSCRVFVHNTSGHVRFISDSFNFDEEVDSYYDFPNFINARIEFDITNRSEGLFDEVDFNIVSSQPPYTVNIGLCADGMGKGSCSLYKVNPDSHEKFIYENIISSRGYNAEVSRYTTEFAKKVVNNKEIRLDVTEYFEETKDPATKTVRISLNEESTLLDMIQPIDTNVGLEFDYKRDKVARITIGADLYYFNFESSQLIEAP